MADWRAAWKHLHRFPEVVRCARQCRQPVRVTLEYLRLRPLDAGQELRLHSGERVRLDTYEDLVTAWIVFFRREYRIPARATTMLDVGANIGCFAIQAAHQRPGARIICLEPYPPTFARLQETVRRNGLEDRVTAWPIGIAAQAGTRLMPDAWPSQSLGMLAPGAVAPGPATEVECRSLDEILELACADLGVNEIDFVKLDAEGAEHESIRAVSREGMRRIRNLGMEYHDNGDRAGLFDVLSRHGFGLESDWVSNVDGGIAHFKRLDG